MTRIQTVTNWIKRTIEKKINAESQFRKCPSEFYHHKFKMSDK